MDEKTNNAIQKITNNRPGQEKGNNCSPTYGGDDKTVGFGILKASLESLNEFYNEFEIALRRNKEEQDRQLEKNKAFNEFRKKPGCMSRILFRY